MSTPWLQGVIDLLDHSDNTRFPCFQLLRAKLESIRCLESLRDLTRLPLLSLSWEEIQIVLSVFSKTSLWTVEDGLYNMISSSESTAPPGCYTTEGHSLASLRSLISDDECTPASAVCWMGGYFGVLRPVSQVDADNVVLRLLDHLLELRPIGPTPPTQVKSTRRPSARTTSSALPSASQ